LSPFISRAIITEPFNSGRDLPNETETTLDCIRHQIFYSGTTSRPYTANKKSGQSLSFPTSRKVMHALHERPLSVIILVCFSD